jgi:hypothetical protein
MPASNPPPGSPDDRLADEPLEGLDEELSELAARQAGLHGQR